MFVSFLFSFFVSFGDIFYENTKILRNLCLHFARQDGQDGNIKWRKSCKLRDKKKEKVIKICNEPGNKDKLEKSFESWFRFVSIQFLALEWKSLILLSVFVVQLLQNFNEMLSSALFWRFFFDFQLFNRFTFEILIV